METHSVPELIRGLKLAPSDLPALRQLLERSLEMVAGEVTLEAMTNRVLQVYQKLLGGTQ
jgi:hypothetical protein